MRLFVKDVYAILQEQMERHNGDMPVECVQDEDCEFHITGWKERHRFVPRFAGDRHALLLPAFTLILTPGKNVPEGGTP